MKPTIYLGADHAGFDTKELVKEHLDLNGYLVEDLGAHTHDPNDDYPQYAKAVAQAVRQHPGSMGILSCGNAEGIMIAANKFDGIRAGLGYSMYAARTLRNDDNANILSVPGRTELTDPILNIIDTFLSTPYSKDERHERRLAQVATIESEE
jgi:ribose 5-phosphate isomerase B